MAEKTNEQKSTLKKILDIGYYVLIGLIILLAIFYSFFTFSTKDGVTSFFGYVVSSVQTDSMTGTLEPGDIIVSKEFDVKTVAPDDIISFYYIEPQTQQRIIVTHRVIAIEGNKIVTQGDLAKSQNSVDKIEYVSYGDVIAKYTGFRIPGLGKVADFLKTPVGFFTCILIPVLLFLFWQVYIFIKTIIEARSLTKQKNINDEARAMAEQMFLEMQKQQAAQSEDASDEKQPSQENNE